MTDPDIADHVYIEPLTAEVVERIIEKEKPDAILPNLGGQMGLNLSMELARSGFLDRSGVRLLACKPDTIDRAEDRQLFKDTMEKLNQPCIPSKVVEAVSAKTLKSCTRSQPTACVFPPSIRSLWKSASPVGKRSNTK